MLIADWHLTNLFIAGSTLTHDYRMPEFKAQLAAKFTLKPYWLKQTHSDIIADEHSATNEADAFYWCGGKFFPVVLTADCVPIIVGSEDGKECAAIHAGWQGLHKNIIAKTIARFSSHNLHAWIAPHIRQRNYEVDSTFKERFNDHPHAFIANRTGHFLADLTAIAYQQLLLSGVQSVADCKVCTFDDARFHSFRRDHKYSGRLATFIIPKEKI